MFLVKYDQSQTGCRSEYSAARSDNHLNFTIGNLLPMPMPFSITHMTMQNGHTIKPATKPLAGLWRE